VYPGTTTVTLERGSTIVVIAAVPAGLCACGEEYVDEPTTQRLMDLADAAARTGGQIEIRQFPAA